MDDVHNSKWKRSLTGMGLAASLVLGIWIGQRCAAIRLVSPGSLMERLAGDTAEAQISAYVRAIAEGDRSAAMAAWELPDWDASEGWTEALENRQGAVTEELLAAGIDREYSVGDVEWWRTCCEPGVITDSSSAGGARYRVRLMSQDGRPLVYMFDVFVRGGAYWGAAMGHPRRYWVLRDVYATDEEPLFWRQVYEFEIRHLEWPPSTHEATP